jgi:polyisoprenoid-binding protein YceI
MTRYLLASLSVFLLCASASAQPVPWNVDENHSRVGFTAKHLGFSKVRGEFKKFTAKAVADAKTGKLVELEAEVDAKSIDTGIEKRDAHLRADDFFAADRYPKLKLVVKDIKWRGKAFTATTTLTIRDVTKDIKFEGQLQGPQTLNLGQGSHLRAAYHATGKINRKDFNLKFAGVAEGVALVADEVEIDIDAELSAPLAVKDTAATAAPAKETKDVPTPATRPAPAKPGSAPPPN